MTWSKNQGINDYFDPEGMFSGEYQKEGDLMEFMKLASLDALAKAEIGDLVQLGPVILTTRSRSYRVMTSDIRFLGPETTTSQRSQSLRSRYLSASETIDGIVVRKSLWPEERGNPTETRLWILGADNCYMISTYLVATESVYLKLIRKKVPTNE